MQISRRRQNWVLSNPIQFEIARGSMAGLSSFFGFGEKDNIQDLDHEVDLWQGTTSTQPIPNQTIGEQMVVFSTDYNDRLSGGTGIQKVEIDYLDSSGNEKREIINLNGTRWIKTVGTNIRFINALHSVQVGSNHTAIGTVVLASLGSHVVTPIGTTAVMGTSLVQSCYNVISSNNNMSLSSLRMVPAKKTYYLAEWSASAANAPVKLRLRITEIHGTRVQNVFLFNDTTALIYGTYEKVFTIPIKIPELCMIKVSGVAWSAGGYGAASYSGILEDDNTP